MELTVEFLFPERALGAGSDGSEGLAVVLLEKLSELPLGVSPHVRGPRYLIAMRNDKAVMAPSAKYRWRRRGALTWVKSLTARIAIDRKPSWPTRAAI